MNLFDGSMLLPCDWIKRKKSGPCQKKDVRIRQASAFSETFTERSLNVSLKRCVQCVQRSDSDSVKMSRFPSMSSNGVVTPGGPVREPPDCVSSKFGGPPCETKTR